LTKGTARTTGDFATVALTGRVGVTRQALQSGTGGVTLFNGAFGIGRDGAQLLVFFGVLFGELGTLEFTLQ